MTGVRAAIDGESWRPPLAADTICPMTLSRFGMSKSETREMVDRELGRLRSRLGEPTDWHMRNSWFLSAFVAIAAARCGAASVTALDSEPTM